jgi:hypothetical protein
MTRIRASEIGTFAFCARAWWYVRQGAESENAPALQSGLAWHRRHGRRVLAAGCLKTIGYLLVIAAIVGAFVILTGTAVG